MALHGSVRVSHLLCEKASKPLFIIYNTRFLLGADTGNVITLYCPQVVISSSAIRKIRVIKACAQPRMKK